MTAYLGLYDPPFAHAANDALWRILREHALSLGLAAPASLDRERDHHEIWNDPGLVFAQTCGLPLTTSLQGRVRLIAAPIYDFPGCSAADYRSFIVVREAAPFASLADLAGARVAFNSRDSHSGYNALYHAVAPLAKGTRFFGAELATGAHVDSLKAVRAGHADACACDCVTFGLIARHRPAWLAGLRIVDETDPAPAPPYVTATTAGDEGVDRWRDALARCFADPRSSAARSLLGLRGFAVPSLETYGRITRMAEIAGTPAEGAAP